MAWFTGLWTAATFAWKGRRILWVLKDLPALIHEAEGIFGPGSGAQKKLHIIDTVYKSLMMAEKAAGKEFVDEDRARKAASWLIDGTVEMFNAFGLWKENR